MKPLLSRILIIEDNIDDADLLLRQLEKVQLHHQVRVIAHGGIALDYLTDSGAKCEHLVAVFLDLKLPAVSGIQILEGIRASERIKHLPVILVTSSNSQQDLDRCKTLGVSSYVQKPISLSAFTKAVADSFHVPGIKKSKSP